MPHKVAEKQSAPMCIYVCRACKENVQVQLLSLQFGNTGRVYRASAHSTLGFETGSNTQTDRFPLSSQLLQFLAFAVPFFVRTGELPRVLPW